MRQIIIRALGVLLVALTLLLIGPALAYHATAAYTISIVQGAGIVTVQWSQRSSAVLVDLVGCPITGQSACVVLGTVATQRLGTYTVIDPAPVANRSYWLYEYADAARARQINWTYLGRPLDRVLPCAPFPHSDPQISPAATCPAPPGSLGTRTEWDADDGSYVQFLPAVRT